MSLLEQVPYEAITGALIGRTLVAYTDGQWDNRPAPGPIREAESLLKRPKQRIPERCAVRILHIVDGKAGVYTDGAEWAYIKPGGWVLVEA